MNDEKSLKKRLIPDIITPNRITVARILMIPVFVVFFFLTEISYHYAIAAVIFAVAALTDFADGYIARKYHLVSNMGKFLDPIADKVLVSTAFILLLTTPHLFNIFGGNWGYLVAANCIVLIMARELIISGFRQVAATTGLVLAAEKLGKYKTTFQDFAVFVLLIALNFDLTTSVGFILAVTGAVLFIIATILTVVSGISYIVKNRQVLKS